MNLKSPENAPRAIAVSLFFDINSRLKKENELLYRLFSSQSMKLLQEKYYADLRTVFYFDEILEGVKRDIDSSYAHRFANISLASGNCTIGFVSWDISALAYLDLNICG